MNDSEPVTRWSDETRQHSRGDWGSRRKLLAVAVSGTPLVAGCSGGGNSSSTPTASQTPTDIPTDTATATPTATPTDTPDQTPTPTPPGTLDGAVVVARRQPNGLGTHSKVPSATAAITREGDTTTYEVTLPWSVLPITRDSTVIGLSLLVNENDGGGRMGYMVWGSGIGGGKDPTEFKRAILAGGDTATASATSEETYRVATYSEAVDGVLEPDDLPATAIDLSEDGEVGSGGVAVTVTGRVWITWHDAGLYLAAIMEDDTHAQSYGMPEIWKGDSLQLGVTEGEPSAATTFREYNIGGNPR